MEIDRKLNLVVPLERSDGSTIYVHSMPIREDVFKQYFLVLSKAFAALYQEGLNVIAGPRIAGLMIEKIATDMGVWEGASGVQNGLMAEIRRLTNVIVLTERGWETIPFEDALSRKLFAPDELSEVEGQVAFFIVASAMHKRKDLVSVLTGLCSLWGAQTTSQNCSTFASSLPISTETDNFGKKATRSSVPSSIG